MARHPVVARLHEQLDILDAIEAGLAQNHLRAPVINDIIRLSRRLVALELTGDLIIHHRSIPEVESGQVVSPAYQNLSSPLHKAHHPGEPDQR